MASAFQISGLSSGIDTAAMLDALKAYRMRPVTLEQAKVSTYTAKQAAWIDINARLLSLSSAAQSLTFSSTFSSVKSAVGDSTVATASANSGAAPGTINLKVTQLAQARKIATKEYASATEALGFTGDFTVNGKAVDVTADDTLTTLASKINALGVGASAAVVQQSPGQFRLTLSGTATGRQDSLSVAEIGAGTSLASLQLINGSDPIARYATGTGDKTVTSLGFSSSTATLGSLMGLPSNVAGTFSIDGTDVAYDTATDTLTTLASKINGANIAGVTATVVTDNVGKQRLQIAGGAPPVFGARATEDSQGLMSMLGVTQATAAATGDPATNRVLAEAKDSKFTIDGLEYTRPTNTVSDAVSGVTLGLAKDGGASTTITLSRDTAASVAAVNTFVTAYNDVMGQIKKQSVYAPGGTTPPLLGDYSLQRIQDDLANSLSTVISGNSAGFSNLRDVGITLSDTGTLSVDSTALTNALNNDPNAVSRLFSSFGTASNPAVSYVSSTSDTKVSTTGYAVNITTMAKQAQTTAGAAHGATLGAPETLTFAGSLFGSAKTITLSAGNTLAQTISQINNSTIGKSLVAYDDAGSLAFRSIEYGAGRSFTVKSDLTGAGTTGIGTTPLVATGVNVAGTINGETATGSGRILTGNQDKGGANGLAISVSASAAAPWGTITFQRGVGASFVHRISALTNTVDGLVTLQQNTIDENITAANENITRLTASVDSYIARLEQQFTSMEVQMSKLKAQSASLAQTVAGWNKSSDDN